MGAARLRFDIRARLRNDRMGRKGGRLTRIVASTGTDGLVKLEDRIHR